MGVGTHYLLDAADIGRLITALQNRGYEVIGPQFRDGAIVYDTLEKAEDLPAGWVDEQTPGRYRASRNGSQAFFGYVSGAQSWKRWFHPPQTCLVQVQKEGAELRLRNEGAAPAKLALLGIRSCELAAIAIQDRVLLEDRYRDPVYAARRNGAFIVAVQCTKAASNCFCTSMNTGPKAHSGFDLALTELIDEEGHRFVVEVGSEPGAELLAELKPHKALVKTVKQAEAAVEACAKAITKQVDTAGLKELLYQNFEHPEWDNVAKRCLNCGNCTLACPTCFCITVEDTSDVTLTRAERWRRWDSCFVQNFSYIHGGSVRMSPKSRYRQWLTHKLASWVDQFGTFGCVGCGRCITWCPVGIDITEEVAVIRGGATAASGGQTDAERVA